MPLTPGERTVHVAIERSQHLPDAVGELLVLEALPEFVIRDCAQNRDGVVVEVLPPTRREFLKNILRFLVPGPPKIVGQLVQADRQFGKLFVRERLLRHRVRSMSLPIPFSSGAQSSSSARPGLDSPELELCAPSS